MNIKEIKDIVSLMSENDINEFEIEREGFRLSIKKGPQLKKDEVVVQAVQPIAAPIAMQTLAPAPAPEEKEEKKEGEFIVSPMVGTFYAAPSTDYPLFVEVGQEVDEDTVVCIIEAMKVMNEIKAEKKGKILEILVETGEPVEFGKELFRIG